MPPLFQKFIVCGFKDITYSPQLYELYMLYAPFDFHKGLSGEGHSHELHLSDKLRLSHAFCKADLSDIFTYAAGRILLYFLTFHYNLQRTEIGSFYRLYVKRKIKWD